MSETPKPMFKGFFENIDDMLAAYYGPIYNGDPMTKASGAVMTDTAGIRNVIYGAKLTEQLLMSGKLFSLISKAPWEKSGFRAVTGISESGTGVGERAAIPNPEAPNLTPVKIKPKVSAVTMSMSSLELDMEGIDDTATYADLLDIKSKEFIHRINSSLCADVSAGAAGNNFESIDRVVSSFAEVDMASLSTGANNIYDIKRTAAGWSDAQVMSAATAGETPADGDLTLDMLSHLITLCQPYWDDENYNGKMFVTGYDVNERINQLIRSEQRYVDTVKAKITVNGISTVDGVDAGIEVAAYNSIPIFCDAKIAKDTLSRVYLLDPEYLKMSIVQPVQYVESDRWLELGYMERLGMFHMSGELTCTKFAGQGKLRDVA